MAVFLGAHTVISPLGYSSRENFEAVLKGQSGLKQHRFGFSESPFCCSRINAAELDQNFSFIGDPGMYTRLEKMCLLSVSGVLKNSSLSLRDPQTLLLLSTTKGNIDLLESPPSAIDPQRAYLPAFAKTIGDFFAAAATPLLLSNACISGLLALIVAKRLIEAGHYKNVLVCGADLISEFTLSGFRSFNALSAEACKPFDLHRNGINLGEGAACILLSSDPIGNLIISAGASANDANHISGPSRNGDGLYQAISRTLKQAGKQTVDLISAHGTATEYNDEMESIAFSRAKLNTVPLNSMKGYYGHTLGAAGLIESIISLESLSRNTLIRSLGFESQGTSEKLGLIEKTQEKKINTCLKTASGFGGGNAAAIFEKL